MSASASVLVVGWSQVGKTVLGAQLLLRLRDGAGRLQLREPPRDVSLLESALTRLSQGLAPQHTPKESLRDLTFNLKSGVDLIWPDYGGEQVRRLTQDARRLPEGWRPLIERSDGWLLLIRPGASRDFPDVVDRPLPTVMQEWRARRPPKDADLDTISIDWTDQALLVETLQILMEVKGHRPGGDPLPTLSVALTCWDELGLGDAGHEDTGTEGNGTGGAGEPTPTALLAERFPLLDAFITANWPTDRFTVFGLSAQGRRLSDDVPDEDYAVGGPEAHGYVVTPSGERTADITVPISQLVDRALT